MEYLRSPQTLPENLRFISVEEVEQIRHEQQRLVQQAGADSLALVTPAEIVSSGKQLVEDASDDMRQQIDAVAELYVADHLSRDENPELFDGCVDLIRRYSVLNMTDEQWRAGEKDADGKYNHPETAGQYRLKEELRVLTGEVDPVPTPDVLDPAAAQELTSLQHDLERSRRHLADMSIRRRQLMGKRTKKAKQLNEEYEAAHAEYKNAYESLGTFSVELMRLAGLSADEVGQSVIAGTITERQAFHAAELEVMQQDNSLLAKIARAYTKLPVMVGANIVVGGTIGRFAKYGFLAAVPVAGVAGLLAARGGKALLTAKVGNSARLNKDHAKRSQEDIENLRTQFDSPDVQVEVGEHVAAENYAKFSENLLKESIDRRVEKDRTSNRNRALTAAAISAGAVAAGSLVASGALGNLHFGKFGDNQEMLEKAKDLGVDSEMKAKIMANPEAFKRMVDDPEAFERFLSTTEQIKQTTGLTGSDLEERVTNTLKLADHLQDSPSIGASDGLIHPQVFGEDVVQAGGFTESVMHGAEVYNVSSGGGIIKDVIRPFANTEGIRLTSSEESAIWSELRNKFGNNIFTDLPVDSHGSDQWIMKSGKGTLRPEVSAFLKARIIR